MQKVQSLSTRFYYTILLVMCVLVSTGSWIFALTNDSESSLVAQNTLRQTDITYSGLNMFSGSSDWETGNFSGYSEDSFRGFSKKLNKILKKEMPELVKSCGWCDTLVESGFDDALTKYRRETPEELTNATEWYFSVIFPYLNKKIQKASIKADSISELQGIISGMVDNITGQVREQMNTFRDVSGMGLYYDGDVNNSPYDLLDDIRRIDEIFFKEAPEFGDYRNTSKNDSSALITGQVQQGSWIGWGKNYDLNLLGDIENAMWGGAGSSNNSDFQGNQIAGDCEWGYCVTVEFVKNTHYFLGGSGGSERGKNSFQWIFEEALEWITKNGDKRNFACKAAPTVFFFETENDMNFEFSEIFSGLGNFVFWKTPKFLLGFLGSNSSQSSSTVAGASQSKEDKKTEDALRSAFKARGMDYDRLTNLKSTTEQAFIDAGLRNATRWDQQVREIGESVSRAQGVYTQLLKEGSSTNRALIHEYNKDSIKHIEKTFDEVTSRVRLVKQFSDDLNKILKYLKEKPDCGN